MLIYRIEHSATNVGPYNSSTPFVNTAQYDMGWSHTNDTHPSMWRDIIKPRSNRVKHRSYYCGFSDIDRMLTWFDGWFDVLRDNGFHIAIYSANNVLDGQYQTVFVKRSAKRIATVSLNNLDLLKQLI